MGVEKESGSTLFSGAGCWFLFLLLPHVDLRQHLPSFGLLALLLP